MCDEDNIEDLVQFFGGNKKKQQSSISKGETKQQQNSQKPQAVAKAPPPPSSSEDVKKICIVLIGKNHGMTVEGLEVAMSPFIKRMETHLLADVVDDIIFQKGLSQSPLEVYETCVRKYVAGDLERLVVSTNKQANAFLKRISGNGRFFFVTDLWDELTEDVVNSLRKFKDCGFTLYGLIAPGTSVSDTMGLFATMVPANVECLQKLIFDTFTDGYD